MAPAGHAARRRRLAVRWTGRCGADTVRAMSTADDRIAAPFPGLSDDEAARLLECPHCMGAL